MPTRKYPARGGGKGGGEGRGKGRGEGRGKEKVLAMWIVRRWQWLQCTGMEALVVAMTLWGGDDGEEERCERKRHERENAWEKGERKKKKTKR